MTVRWPPQQNLAEDDDWRWPGDLWWAKQVERPPAASPAPGQSWHCTAASLITVNWSEKFSFSHSCVTSHVRVLRWPALQVSSSWRRGIPLHKWFQLFFISSCCDPFRLQLWVATKKPSYLYGIILSKLKIQFIIYCLLELLLSSVEPGSSEVRSILHHNIWRRNATE